MWHQRSDDPCPCHRAERCQSCRIFLSLPDHQFIHEVPKCEYELHWRRPLRTYAQSNVIAWWRSPVRRSNTAISDRCPAKRRRYFHPHTGIGRHYRQGLRRGYCILFILHSGSIMYRTWMQLGGNPCHRSHLRVPKPITQKTPNSKDLRDFQNLGGLLFYNNILTHLVIINS